VVVDEVSAEEVDEAGSEVPGAVVSGMVVGGGGSRLGA
jgi:hypothetical protein